MPSNYYSTLSRADKEAVVTLARAAAAEYETPSRAIADEWGIPVATAYNWIHHLENEGYIQPGEVVKRRRPMVRHRNGHHPEPVGPPVIVVGEPFVLVLTSGERLEVLMVEGDRPGPGADVPS